ncbi:hypothetical protein OBBRIDRAFT_467687 [Obba rivulosa]|uniref:Uncharacterized protein n=1 Tax=Obba rivulosa TaxID=1052685 RepID=A0A8E2DL85_9APHY|nr:hypothetical protein OBBRIDRAFT_467687 [Obba rivulosa]
MLLDPKVDSPQRPCAGLRVGGEAGAPGRRIRSRATRSASRSDPDRCITAILPSSHDGVRRRSVPHRFSIGQRAAHTSARKMLRLGMVSLAHSELALWTYLPTDDGISRWTVNCDGRNVGINHNRQCCAVGVSANDCRPLLSASKNDLTCDIVMRLGHRCQPGLMCLRGLLVRTYHISQMFGF